MWLVLAAMRRPVTVVVAMLAMLLRAGAWRSAHAGGHLPGPRRARHLRRAAVRRHGSGADGRLLTYYYEYHFLYITGIEHVESQEHPGRGADEAGLPSGHGYEPGDGASGRLCEPCPGVHASREPCRRSSCASTRAAFRSDSWCSPARRARRARCRISRSTGSAAVCDAAGRFGAAAVRWQSANDCCAARSRQLRAYRISPEEAIAAVNRSSSVHAVGQCAHRRSDSFRDARTPRIGGNLAELMDAPVRGGSGTAVYLRDIGDVEIGTDISPATLMSTASGRFISRSRSAPMPRLSP